MTIKSNKTYYSQTLHLAGKVLQAKHSILLDTVKCYKGHCDSSVLVKISLALAYFINCLILRFSFINVH
jgi:hypothetical protein